ncbi:hypothetical protein FF38_03581, partial [Lucilia cuprina]
MEFQIIEEVDFGEDINTRARIVIHGKASQAFRRIFGNFFGRFRRRSAAFSFKPSFNADTITVEWPIESGIAVFPGDVSTLMVRLGYARNLTKEEVEQYNSSADFEDANTP